MVKTPDGRHLGAATCVRDGEESERAVMWRKLSGGLGCETNGDKWLSRSEGKKIERSPIQTRDVARAPAAQKEAVMYKNAVLSRLLSPRTRGVESSSAVMRCWRGCSLGRPTLNNEEAP